MISLSTLFSGMAQAFTEGNLTKMVEAIQTPTSVYIGERVIVVREVADLLQYMGRYRQNLVDAGFVRANFEIVSEAITGHRRVKLQGRWTYLDHQDGIVNQIDVEYFCNKTPGDFWQIQLIQVAAPATSKFQKGLPVS